MLFADLEKLTGRPLAIIGRAEDSCECQRPNAGGPEERYGHFVSWGNDEASSQEDGLRLPLTVLRAN